MAKTDFRTMFDKDYIGAWSLPEGRDVTVTITKVIGGQLTGVGGRKTRKPVIYMQGTEKGMALNATNSKAIAGMYGNYVEDWVGKRVSLFRTTTSFGSETMECIRIRPKVPQTKAAPNDAKLNDEPPPPPPEQLGEEPEPDVDWTTEAATLKSAIVKCGSDKKQWDEFLAASVDKLATMKDAAQPLWQTIDDMIVAKNKAFAERLPR